MANDYTPKVFLRQTPNELLKAYFEALGVLKEIKWASLAETEVDAIYDAWQGREAAARADRERLSKGARTGNRRRRSRDHRGRPVPQAGLGPNSTAREGHHAKALWTFRNHTRVFDVASLMDSADHLDRRYRRKRNYTAEEGARRLQNARDSLSAALAAYYWETQGRGRNCKMDVYLPRRALPLLLRYHRTMRKRSSAADQR